MTATTQTSRIERLQKLLKDRDLEAILLCDRVNVRYMSGFDGSYGILLVDQERATLITDERYAEIASGMVSSGVEVLTQPIKEVDEFFKNLFAQRSYKSLGFEGTLTVDQFDALRKRLDGQNTETRKAGDMVLGLRAVKDDEEIALIEKAANLADQVMSIAFESIKPGMKESDLSRIIRRAAEDLGGTGESFTNIVATGANSSRPHHSPGESKIQFGDMITLDLGVIYGGYCSDLTRNPVLGKLDKNFEKIYDVCLNAQEAAIKAIRAGAHGKDVDSVARDIISAAGFGKFFGHGLGHGVGQDIHESPRLSQSSGDTLKVGNVVTVEPGIYVPGFGGVRIEDLVVVTEEGCRVLSHSPKELTVLPVS